MYVKSRFDFFFFLFISSVIAAYFWSTFVKMHKQIPYISVQFPKINIKDTKKKLKYEEKKKHTLSSLCFECDLWCSYQLNKTR